VSVWRCLVEKGQTGQASRRQAEGSAQNPAFREAGLAADKPKMLLSFLVSVIEMIMAKEDRQDQRQMSDQDGTCSSVEEARALEVPRPFSGLDLALAIGPCSSLLL
jgi:hypothetical protein